MATNRTNQLIKATGLTLRQFCDYGPAVIYGILEQAMTDNNIPFAENTMKDASEVFCALFKKEIEKQSQKYGFDIKAFHPNWCECSGFITNSDGKCVYFNSGDFRMSSPYSDPLNHILIRTARDINDFHGGYNNYTTINDFGENVTKLMGLKIDQDRFYPSFL